jgi:hypothetical protein
VPGGYIVDFRLKGRVDKEYNHVLRRVSRRGDSAYGTEWYKIEVQ